LPEKDRFRHYISFKQLPHQVGQVHFSEIKLTAVQSFLGKSQV